MVPLTSVEASGLPSLGHSTRLGRCLLVSLCRQDFRPQETRRSVREPSICRMTGSASGQPCSLMPLRRLPCPLARPTPPIEVHRACRLAHHARRWPGRVSWINRPYGWRTKSSPAFFGKIHHALPTLDEAPTEESDGSKVLVLVHTQAVFEVAAPEVRQFLD